MQHQLEQLKKEFHDVLDHVTDRASLEEIKNQFLGRKGKLKTLLKDVARLADEERKTIGAIANEVKDALEAAYGKKESEFLKANAGEQTERDWIDITEPGQVPSQGHLHLTTQAIEEIGDIFSRIGFTQTRAPEIDWDYYVFESLNMPKDHPARDDWETFFVDLSEGKKGKIVLTPHTSNSQVRYMEENEPPIRMININRTYRRQIDVSHIPMFHQFEGLLIDKGIAVTHLKGVLDYFARTFFGEGRKTRLRPHHFRFTEPSFEVDITCGACGGIGALPPLSKGGPGGVCRLCKGGWLELGGAGMVHPRVLEAGGLDSNIYSGFAFGWGVERTLMMREGIKIDDMRILYKNDLRFVEQF